MITKLTSSIGSINLPTSIQSKICGQLWRLKSTGEIHKKIEQLKEFCEEKWKKIPVDFCKSLVGNYEKRLESVTQNREQNIKSMYPTLTF